MHVHLQVHCMAGIQEILKVSNLNFWKIKRRVDVLQMSDH